MTLFVGHLHERIKDTTLLALFEPYGSIVSIDRKGTYAFIEYALGANTEQAVQDLNRKEVMGSVIRVELSNRERGAFGPPPGDLSETCYSCQQIGHIAKNCPLSVQPPQIQHLHRVQPRQREYLQQSLYDQEAATSFSSRKYMYKQNRFAKREGFLDRNPQKMRLVDHGSQRLRVNSYTQHMDDGSYSGTKKKCKSKTSASATLYLPQSLQPPGLTSHNRPYGRPPVFSGAPIRIPISPSSQKKKVQKTPAQYRGDHSADLILTSTQSMLTSDMIKTAEEIRDACQQPAELLENMKYNSLQAYTMVANVDTSDHIEEASSNIFSSEFVKTAQNAAKPESYIPHKTSKPIDRHNPQTVQTNILPENTPTVENPYLPPGTLVYLPMITVLPQKRTQQSEEPPLISGSVLSTTRSPPQPFRLLHSATFPETLSSAQQPPTISLRYPYVIPADIDHQSFEYPKQGTLVTIPSTSSTGVQSDATTLIPLPQQQHSRLPELDQGKNAEAADISDKNSQIQNNCPINSCARVMQIPSAAEYPSVSRNSIEQTQTRPQEHIQKAWL